MSTPPGKITTSQLLWAVKHRDLSVAAAIALIDRRIDDARSEGAAAERVHCCRLAEQHSDEKQER